jgi:8-oxo-dGTP diphosphatase
MLSFDRVEQVDWGQWSFQDYAVLCFIRDERSLLLIRKKLGLGSGKINGPGGRLNPGETPEEAAIRETREEVGLLVSDLSRVAELSFIFLDGYSLHCTVFLAQSFSGTLRESPEAAPFWCPVEKIPYHKMWEDDRFWLPRVLQGEKIRGCFLFDGEKMTSCRITSDEMR